MVLDLEPIKKRSQEWWRDVGVDVIREDVEALLAEVKRLNRKVDYWNYGYAKAVRNGLKDRERWLEAERKVQVLRVRVNELEAKLQAGGEEVRDRYTDLF